MNARDNTSYWARACHFFRRSGLVGSDGSYFIHNKNAGTVKIGVMCQRSVRVGGGHLTRSGEGEHSVTAQTAGGPVFKQVESQLIPDAPCFLLASPDLQRAFVDETLPLVQAVQPALEFTFSDKAPDGELSYARDAAHVRKGTELLAATPDKPNPLERVGPVDRPSFDDLSLGWTPTEGDESFLARLTNAVQRLQEHPAGKLTLTRAYQRKVAAVDDPFRLYELHAGVNGDYAFSHFFSSGDGFFSLGVTPENVFEMANRTLTVDVVAATCKAGGDEAFLAKELLENPKQLKEHGASLHSRQDRFRPFCEEGSIRVVQDMQTKTLRNVCHLHSVFTGRLLPAVSAFDLMGNLFPLLGARPRELLCVADAEAAPHRYYGGVVAHIHGDRAGGFLNIRNALYKDGVLHAKVGVGVIRESDPHSELVETRDKLSGLLEAVHRWESTRRSTAPAPARRETRLALDGGERVRSEVWPTYDKGYVDLNQGDEAAAVRAIRSRRLFRYDDRTHRETEVAQLERELTAYFGSQYALACSSGTTALALALMGLGVGPGDAVACPAFTFAATPSAIVLAGARPVIVEVDENLHMDPEDLAAKLTPDVKAVIAVHMRGFGCDIERLVAVADARGVPLVEDAVPALGVDLGGRKLGTFGRVGAFSTQSDKSINTGEGGFLVTSDRTVFERAVVLSGAYEQQLHRHTAPSLPTISDLSLPIFSFRMDEIRGAMARHQLCGLDTRVETFQRNYLYVAARLESLAPIQLRRVVAERAFLGESLIFRLAGAGPQEVRWFVEALCAEGIGARALGDDARPNVRCFWNWRFAFPEMTREETIRRYSRSATFLQEAIDIPLSITLTRQDCDELVAAVEKVCIARSRRTSPVRELTGNLHV